MNAGDLQRAVFRCLVGGAAMAALPFHARDGRVAVFYAGARAGPAGGAPIKVSLLARRFSNHWFGYSLVYVLSNAIYLPQSALTAIARAGVPIVLNQNGVFYPGWYPRGWERENSRIAAVHRLANHVFYQSEFCRRCAVRFLGARIGESEILYNAVDTARFSPALARTAKGPFNFLVSGKIGTWTAYRLLSSIEGLAVARRGGLDVQLTVAGAIDRSVEIQARARAGELGMADAVAFTGRYGQSDAPAIYRAADAYLMTKHNDPCPNVVLEAMACGLPVLYSASGGVPELVGEEAGIGLAVPDTFDDTPAPEPAAIADGMARMLRTREAMSAAARRRAVTRFALTEWLDRHAALFAQLVRVGSKA